LALGVGLLSEFALGRAMSWAPNLIYPLGSWLLGIRPDYTVKPWALWLRPSTDTLALAISVAMLVGGCLVFVLGRRRHFANPW
jgi:hypothetical protein